MREQIKSIIGRVFNIKNVRDDISQHNCVEWDSLKHLNLIIELEEEFNISFDPEDIVVMTDINSITEKIQQLK
jgi:acyl carrier protein